MVHALIRLYHDEAPPAITISAIPREPMPPLPVQNSRINI